jgi:peptide/nickel transport system permease protein
MSEVAGTAPLPPSTRPGRAAARHYRPSWLTGFVKTQPLGTVGLVIVLVMAAAALFARYVAPYDPTEISFVDQLQPPSLEHPLGTDGFGRDIFSRIVYGSRTALLIGFVSAFIGCTVGALVGVTSAYFGGRVDLVTQRLVDIVLAFPIVVLALIVIAVLKKTPVLGIDLNVVIAIAIPFMPKAARVVRSAALTVVRLSYVDAARAAGYSAPRIILAHVLPNVMAPYLILLTAFIGQAILLEATLSFLGLGVAEPTPAWGLMLAGTNVDFYRAAPWLIVFPGLAISLAVFAFNLFGDSLRDFLDPHLKF